MILVMRSSLCFIVGVVAAVFSTSSLRADDDSPKSARQLEFQQSSKSISIKSLGPNTDPAFVAVFRIHAPKITYSAMFDGLVPDEMRDRMFFKGMHLFYPAQRVRRPVRELILKRQSEVPRPRIPKDLKDRTRRALLRNPRVRLRLTDEQRAVATKIEEFEKAASALLTTPIVAVWGLQTSDGSPDERLVLYANGRANDPGGKLSWDWRGGKITVDFQDKQRQLTVAADGRTLTGRWIGETETKGRLLGYSKTPTMPVLATWHMQNAKGIVSTVKLYANGRVNDQHAKATWSWSDAKLAVSTSENATAAEFTIGKSGRSMKGRWQMQGGILAELHNPVITFVTAGPQTLKPNDPKLWASLDRSTTDYFKLLISDVPKNRRPPQPVMDFFTKQASDANFQIVPISESDVEFRIVATTARQAEALARGLLGIYDYGVIGPIQTFLQHRMKLLEEQLKTQEADVARIKQEVKDDLQQADRPPLFDEATAKLLNEQKKQLSIKAAGLKAQVAEAVRLLNANPPDKAGSAKLKITRLTAEIELAGVAAQLAKVEEIRSRQATRQRDRAKLLAARSRLGRPEYHVRKTGNIIGAHSHVIRRYVPFQVVEGQVIISPLKRAEAASRR